MARSACGAGRTTVNGASAGDARRAHGCSGRYGTSWELGHHVDIHAVSAYIEPRLGHSRLVSDR